ncbi:Protein tolR [Bibersteinia trehalosi USDA-ARS-USMARC-188]|uniref:Tol-Pal system protein TolR n=5 Tax=Bibersteinia trehalosi TaxID=47735 RepID=W0R5Q5_BIBTR|nr:colicin uptake protein TolR [Bibersteinia trehalosi]AGH38127.1 Protein tolR [Bibersteinia trehalosi USDA-ARS-USMARC-192]AHG82071.1 Protein tolR [Bibersteinia trehalosi USDA-ARS-USMARC-188]AHG84380.1 Protein tolR [Bibersteinia trehalosi USDA-ARS-USMARC-189]AHG86106.1 Protein tolR [Bibersteinia trehalosi USDA-ARS-USMARC-190]OAQ15350.1 colicin transporter [Bibersteinia trehalosi Y31]
MSDRRRKRNDIKSEINIVPFLDVLLVLLLIFMATAPIISQSVEVELPEDRHSQSVSNEDKTPVILEIAGVGLYKLKIEGNYAQSNGAENISDDEVVAYAADAFQKDNNTLFLVAGGKDVPYEEVMKGISLLKDAGIKSVGLMTEGK